jgi:hypothetical protein
MAKRKKQTKVKRRGKLPRRDPAKRGKARKVSKAATKRTVAKAKPKRAPVKKAAQKEVAPAVETVEAPEFEEVSRVSPGPDEPEE